MKCYNCGGKNEKENKYCKYCGVFLKYIPTKVYPNCSTCKWLDYSSSFYREICNAQAFEVVEECYGTPNCFGVYEKIEE